MFDKKSQKYQKKQKNYLYWGWRDSFSDEKRDEVIGNILYFAMARKQGVLNEHYPYWLEPPLADMIIDRLADNVIDFASGLVKLAPKKEKRNFPKKRIYYYNTIYA